MNGEILLFGAQALPLAHPTRFERPAVAVRALLIAPNQPWLGRCRPQANRLNEPQRTRSSAG
jgi:hypothetical protein